MSRNPDEIHRFSDYAEDVPNVIKIPELDFYATPDYDLFDEKGKFKYLCDIEKVVRGSFEYHQMVAYLRENVDMNQCSYYRGVSNAATTKIHIEIHHEPLSLFDIVETVYEKRAHFGESLEVEYVAKEVMYNHYTMTVGLIPLAETVHELVHNKYLFIPNDKVFGGWRRFVDLYEDFIPSEVKANLDLIQQYTNSMEISEDYKDLLSKHYIYYDVSGSYALPTLDQVQRMMKDRVNEIMNCSNMRINQIPREEEACRCPFVEGPYTGDA